MKLIKSNIILIFCLFGIILSFIYHLRQNIDNIGIIKAPVFINIEIDKTYISSVSISLNSDQGDSLINLSVQESYELQNIILHGNIQNGNRPVPFLYNLYLNIPKHSIPDTLNSITAISIFIGNKLFYFSNNDIINLSGKEKNNFICYDLSGLEYKKSAVSTLLKLPRIINWYGDFNFLIKVIFSFLFSPGTYILTWIFLLFLLILFKSFILETYNKLKFNKLLKPEFLFLTIIVLIGFILRVNGFDWHSSWLDELFSACQASNPNLAFINILEDPGNPPFYFLLLRFWFQLFGWSETNGRLLSVFIGTASIVSFYILLNCFTNKKVSILATLYMSVSAYFIGYSQEMRPYILVVFLVTLTAHRFLIMIKCNKLKYQNYILYIILASLLVNTHYFGVLFVFSSFLFYIIYKFITKTINKKNIILFFIINIIIALSLLPYFLHTAINKALLNRDFNTWIGKPGFSLMILAVIIPILWIIYYLYIKCHSKKIISVSSNLYFNYSLFITSTVFLISYFVSLFRPILTLKYLIIIDPFIISLFSIILIIIINNELKIIRFISILLIFLLYVNGYNTDYGGGSDVYKEAHEFIINDTQTNSQSKSMEVFRIENRANPSFYNFNDLPLYTIGDKFDILYFNPYHRSIDGMYNDLENIGINKERILKIYINDRKSILKIYGNL